MNELDSNIPLVVDLDGTLLKADLPSESFVSVMLHSPIKLLHIIFFIAVKKTFSREPASFKLALAKEARNLHLEKLPWSPAFLDYLIKERKVGRRLVLCTGSTQIYADQVGKLFNLFESVYGSSRGYNLTGKNKAKFLLNKYGDKKFDYAGNAMADFKVAAYARDFILVNPTFCAFLLSLFVNIKKQFKDKNLRLKALFYCLGVKYYLVNSIVLFVPLFFSDSDYWFACFISFCSFNSLASGACVLFCLSSTKTERNKYYPYINNHRIMNLFASGDISMMKGLYLLVLFTIIYLVCILWIPISGLFQILIGLLYILSIKALGLKWSKILKLGLLCFLGCIITLHTVVLLI